MDRSITEINEDNEIHILGPILGHTAGRYDWCRHDEEGVCVSINQSRRYTHPIPLMLAHRLQRWTNIKTTLGVCIVFADLAFNLRPDISPSDLGVD